ncbi:hypothetical protein [Anaerosporobacter sp.]
MGRISMNIESSLEQQWNHVIYFKNDFKKNHPDTMESVLSYLSEAESNTSLHIKRVYVIDKDARCYRLMEKVIVGRTIPYCYPTKKYAVFPLRNFKSAMKTII